MSGPKKNKKSKRKVKVSTTQSRLRRLAYAMAEADMDMTHEDRIEYVASLYLKGCDALSKEDLTSEDC